jgi:polyhydroxybutyrate depolymerase
MKKYLLLIFTSLCLLSATAQTGSFVFGGLTRDYILHLPTGYSPSTHYPLVIDMHGYTSNASQQQLYTKFDSISNAQHFIVVYPNGIASSWNSGWVGTYGTGVDDVGFVSALIDTLNANYSIDLQRVYATGMSNGGFQSYRLACELSDRIAAIASVTGSLTDSTAYYCRPTRTVPIMEVHGTADPVVDYGGLAGSYGTEATLNFWKAKNGCSGITDTFAIPDISPTDSTTALWIRWRSCRDSSEMWFIKIIGGGHTWPNALLDIPSYGRTSRDFSANQYIWSFFQRYRLGMSSGMSNIANQAELDIYPNPSNEIMHVRGLQSGDHIMLLDMNGREVRNILAKNDEQEISMANLQDGVYVLQIANAHYNMAKRIIVAH